MAPTIRSATAGDLPQVARLAAQLVRMHHAFDEKRFMLKEPIESGYEWWLRKEIENANALVLVAMDGAEVCGYAYARLEERDWSSLRDACAFLHDILVDKRARRKGIAKALVDETKRRMTALGAPRLMLGAAAKNEAAQRFFESQGFRRTMIEMTLELG